jgi:hypothetical protein
MNNPAYGANPGIRAIQETVEADVWFAGHNFSGLVTSSSGVKIAAENRDATNSPDTTLIGGNVFGTDSNDEQLVYDPSGTDGSQIPWGILPKALDLLESNTPVDRGLLGLIQAGHIKSSRLSATIDPAAWAMLVRQGIFPDYRPIGAAGLVHPMGTVRDLTGADPTLTVAHNGQLRVNLGANAYVLPAAVAAVHGMSVEFLHAGGAAEEMSISSAASDIIVFGDLTADGVSYETTAEMIGSRCRFLCIATAVDTYRWIVENIGGTTMTIVT